MATAMLSGAVSVACAPSPDADGSGSARLPLDAARLEALARYDSPLADSMHACVPLDSVPAANQDRAVVAFIHPGDRYRCELRRGVEFTVALVVDTLEVGFPVITGLRAVDDSADVGELTASTDEPPPRGFHFLGTQDIDGDGVRELKLLSFWGATGNVGWTFWRRDTTANRWLPDARLIAMSNPQPLRDAPCLRIRGGGGMAARIYTAVVYCNDSGTWIERWHEHQEWDKADGFFLRTLRVRLPGQDSLAFLRTDTVRDTLAGG